VCHSEAKPTNLLPGAHHALLRLHRVEQITASVQGDHEQSWKACLPAQELLDVFTARYNFDMLVYYEMFSQVANVIACEKQIKSCRREKKLRLILAENPSWQDLRLEWEDGPSCPSRITMNLPPESQTN
jgi:hypothetical protein